MQRSRGTRETPPSPSGRNWPRRWWLAAGLAGVTSIGLVSGSLAPAVAGPDRQPGPGGTAAGQDRAVDGNDRRERTSGRRVGAILPRLMPVPDLIPPQQEDRADEERRLVPCDTGELINAINLANEAGQGTLLLDPDCTYTITEGQDGSGLPPITGRITILGRDATIVRAANSESFRIFTVENGGVLNLDDTRVAGGQTDTDGGGILVEAGGIAALRDCTVDTNRAEDFGGGIANYGVITVARSTFDGNEADRRGGGVANFGSATVARSTTFENNSGANGGGGLYNRNLLTVDNSRITNNFAGAGVGFGFGGGIFSFRDGITVVSNSVIDNNVSTDAGGGVGSNNDISTTIVNTRITGNRAGNGGGMYAETQLTMRNVTVAENIALVGGGLDIIDDEANATITDTVIEENRAMLGAGGGLRNLSATITVRDTHIEGNHTAFDGGGIANGNFGTVTLIGTRVVENTAPENADDGGIMNFSGTVTVGSGTEIFNNRPRNCFDVPGCFN